VTHAQTWASDSALYRFGRLSLLALPCSALSPDPPCLAFSRKQWKWNCASCLWSTCHYTPVTQLASECIGPLAEVAWLRNEHGLVQYIAVVYSCAQFFRSDHSSFDFGYLAWLCYSFPIKMSKIVNELVDMPSSSVLISAQQRTWGSHSLWLETLRANTNPLKYSVFPELFVSGIICLRTLSLQFPRTDFQRSLSSVDCTSPHSVFSTSCLCKAVLEDQYRT